MLNLLNDCSDFELLSANLNMDQLSSIESIISNGGEEQDTGEAFYSLVVDWFIGNIDAEKLIEGILSMDNSNDSILDKFESVEIQNNSRLSGEDAEFCMKQQALYEKIHSYYSEMYLRLQALKQFEDDFYKSVSGDNAYYSGSHENKIYRYEFFKFDEDDFMQLITNVHIIFVRQINRYFRDKYKITIEDKDAKTYLGVKKPKEPELPHNYFRMTEEEKSVYKVKKQEYAAEYEQYIKSFTCAKLHYDCVVDDIFMLLGAFTFAEQVENEIKDGVLSVSKCSYEVRSRKVVLDILTSFRSHVMKQYEVSLNGEDYKALLRALSYFDSDKRNASIYDGWLNKFVTYTKYEQDGIYDTHSTGGSKVTDFRFYKNGKFEVTFINHRTALEFAREFLGYKEEAA